jgi:sulfur carrier protein ThiS
MSPVNATIDGTPIQLKPVIQINDEIQKANTVIQDRDRILITYKRTLAAALELLNRQSLITEVPFSLLINQKTTTLKTKRPHFYNNGIEIRTSYLINDGDTISIELPAPLTLADVLKELGKKLYDEITVSFNETPVTIHKPILSVMLNGVSATENDFVKAGDTITFTSSDDRPITFGDVFAFIDYQLPENSSSKYQLIRNNSSIGFNDQIFGGDTLAITFTQ